MNGLETKDVPAAPQLVECRVTGQERVQILTEVDGSKTEVKQQSEDAEMVRGGVASLTAGQRGKWGTPRLMMDR